MKIIEYLDNDHLNKPSTSGASVFALNDPTPVSKQQIIERYPKVFSEGVGLLEGHYHIRLDTCSQPSCSKYIYVRIHVHRLIHVCTLVVQFTPCIQYIP